MRKLDILLLDPKWSLFKIKKTRNTTIKSSSDRSGGDDRYWPALVRDGAEGGDGRHNTLEGG
jgi:hypothetical protein